MSSIYDVMFSRLPEFLCLAFSEVNDAYNRCHFRMHLVIDWYPTNYKLLSYILEIRMIFSGFPNRNLPHDLVLNDVISGIKLLLLRGVILEWSHQGQSFDTVFPGMAGPDLTSMMIRGVCFDRLWPAGTVTYLYHCGCSPLSSLALHIICKNLQESLTLTHFLVGFAMNTNTLLPNSVSHSISITYTSLCRSYYSDTKEPQINSWGHFSYYYFSLFYARSVFSLFFFSVCDPHCVERRAALVCCDGGHLGLFWNKKQMQITSVFTDSWIFSIAN